MGEQPWEADRFLDAGLAASLVAEQFPELASQEVRFLGNGWDNDCYRVGDEWVFRFPRREDALPYFRNELRLMSLVSPRLSLPTPFFELFGSPTDSFPYPFAAYRYLPGIPWADSLAVDQKGIAAQLGQALGELHSVSEEVALQAGVAPCTWGVSEDLTELLDSAPDVRSAMPSDLLLHWESVLNGGEAFPVYEGPWRLVHNDLGLEHVLVDPDSGLASGIIDFADAELSDPARDFAVFYFVFGEEFLREALVHYPMPLDRRFMDRVHYLATVRSPIWLVHAWRRKDAEGIEKHLRRLRQFVERSRPG